MYGREAGPLFQRYAELLEQELGDLNGLDDELRTSVAALDDERAKVCDALAAAYLPRLDADALASAEARTGFRGFTQRRLLDAMAREERKIQEHIGRLVADERWRNRDALVGPYGSLTRALAEARDMLEPWQRECARFEDLEGFEELVAVRYDTPEFEERWWQPAYWRHWAAGDRICTSLRMADFGDDVLPAYEKVRAPRDQWRAEATRIQDEVNAVHHLVKERDQAEWRLANLSTIYLDEARKVLAQHLVRADVQLLADWAGDDRSVLIHLKHLSGLAAKAEFLTETRERWIGPLRGQLAQAREKFVLKATKLARPKKWNKFVTVPAGFEEKRAARLARVTKVRAQAKRLLTYSDYERFDLSQPQETWWLHMNNNRRPGVFNPGLRTWYDRNPNVMMVVDSDWDDAADLALAAATLAAHADRPDVGDIS